MDVIVIMNRRWGSRRHKIWSIALRQMEREYPGYNLKHFGGRLQDPTLDLDDGPARFLVETAHGSLFVPLAMAEREPWRMVQETMLQQMVHQYIFQHLRLPAGPLHEREFLRFCQQPRVRLDLSMSYGLPGYAATAQTPEEERLYERIQRLLALGESPNRHEAESALREAHRLMLKHNIDLSLRPDPKAHQYGVRHLHRPLEKISEANNLLAVILRDFFFVKILWMPSFDVNRGPQGTHGRVLEICGTQAGLDLACHVHHFLIASAERLWQAHRQTVGIPDNTGRTDFTTGVFQGFWAKLAKQKQKDQTEGLVWLGDSGLDDFFNEMHPKTKPVETARKRGWTAARRAGMDAGRGLELHTPLTEAAAAAEGQRSPAFTPEGLLHGP